jgi:hypothetical protein
MYETRNGDSFALKNEDGVALRTSSAVRNEDGSKHAHQRDEAATMTTTTTTMTTMTTTTTTMTMMIAMTTTMMLCRRHYQCQCHRY